MTQQILTKKNEAASYSDQTTQEYLHLPYYYGNQY